MSDSPVDEIFVSIEADASPFIEGMKDVQDSMTKFSDKGIGQFKNALDGMEIKQRTAFKMLGNVAKSAFGEAGSMAAGAVTSFLKFGPAVGAVMAAMTVANAANEETKRQMEQLKKYTDYYTESLEKLQRTLHGGAKIGGFAGDINNQLEETKKKLNELNKDIYNEKNPTGFVTGTFTRFGLKNPQIAKLEAEKKQFEELKAQQEAALEPLRKLEEEKLISEQRMHNIFGTTATDSMQRFKEEQAEVNRLIDEYDNTLQVIGEDNQSYNDILAERNRLEERAWDLADGIAKKQSDALKAQEDALKKQRDEWERQEAAITKAGEALTNSMLTPLEEMNKEIEDARDLFMQGAISAETFHRAEKAAQDKYDKSIAPKQEFQLGFATQLDTSRVSSDAMRMAASKTKKTDEEVKKTIEESNKYLAAIAERIGGGARTV